MSKANIHIPTITLTNDKTPITIKETVDCLRNACENIGFFYLQIDPSIVPHHVISKTFEQSKQFFSLPLEVKQRCVDSVLNRGYTSMCEETLDPSKQRIGDTKEGYYIGIDVSKDSEDYNPSKLAGPNVWPTESENEDIDLDCLLWKDTMNDYFEIMKSVGFRIVQLLALAIGLPEDYFDDKFDPPMAILRLLHYSKQKSDPDDGIFACGAHSDYGMITILATDDQPGLQILIDNIEDDGKNTSEWIDVNPPTLGTFVVNLGDMLERWTNGKFKSTIHRVLNYGENERYSIPFFYEPNFDTIVQCLDTCKEGDEEPRYPITTAGHHLLEKYNQTHADFQSQHVDR